MDVGDLLLVVASWCASGTVGAALGYWLTGRCTGGMLLGFLLGPFGWPFCFGLPDCRPRCAACRLPIEKGASVCPYCRTATAAPARPAMPAPKPIAAPTCKTCGAEGISSIEMGRTVFACPACGVRI